MQFQLAKGYLGMCFTCNGDLWASDPEVVTVFTKFLRTIPADDLFPEITGVREYVHRGCKRADQEIVERPKKKKKKKKEKEK
jgi:hypothetical protein